MSSVGGTRSAAGRILVISSDKYPPFRVDVKVLFGKDLAGRGFVIDWLLQSQEHCEKDYEVAWGAGKVFVGRTDCGTSLLHRLNKHLRGLMNDLRVTYLARQYDVVQVKDKALIALPAFLAARAAGRKFVYWLSFPNAEASLYMARTGQARYPLLYRIRGWLQFVLLYKWILPRSDHIFVQSEQMKRDLEGYGIPADSMTAVPMGIDPDTFANLEIDSQPQVARSPIVAYLGTLAGERRMDFLVRCMAQVIARKPQSTLLLVGNGDRPGDNEAIMEEARRLGIAGMVRITGFLPQKQALEMVSAAAVCVSPFFPTPILNSTSPTKLVEYMALGRPVVANDHPEQRLVLELSRAGYCVPYDETAFADAIVRVLEQPEEAAAMGLRGKQFVRERRAYPQVADIVQDRYRQIMKSAGAG